MNFRKEINYFNLNGKKNSTGIKRLRGVLVPITFKPDPWKKFLNLIAEVKGTS